MISPAVHVDEIILHECPLSLLRPVEGARQIHRSRRVGIVEVISEGISGFGEISVLESPTYSHEWRMASRLLLSEILIPRLYTLPTFDFTSLDWLVGNSATRFGLESALLDLLSKKEKLGLTEYLGLLFDTSSYDTGRRIYFGATVGAIGGWDNAKRELEGLVDKGVRRVKVKLNRERLLELDPHSLVNRGVEVGLDFNGSLTSGDLKLLRSFDKEGIAFFEEPVSDLGFPGQGKLATVFSTKVLLDESIDCPSIMKNLGFLNNQFGFVIKPFRFGSVVLFHSVLEKLADSKLSCYLGGMFESAIGRRNLLAFSSHRCFNMVGDMAPSDWYYESDIGPPVVAQGPSGDFLLPQFRLGNDVPSMFDHKCNRSCTSYINR